MTSEEPRRPGGWSAVGARDARRTRETRKANYTTTEGQSTVASVLGGSQRDRLKVILQSGIHRAALLMASLER